MREITLVNRHTTERLVLRAADDGTDRVFLRGSLEPGRPGPPPHVHLRSDERGRVLAGTAGVRVGRATSTHGPGSTLLLPKGIPHAWWNAGDDLLEMEAEVDAAGAFIPFLAGIFELANASPTGRPSLPRLARLLRAHRHEYRLAVPAVVDRVLFPILARLA
ncbi:cupin domain-containing protein [Roseisolibacter sp. H3M3-2]|uniref:cupin domain-containing protein n=1 Tax=Roseisolibacter sp. H3M3-2 TaxID=3031323 RepID=UPI0023D984B1|nr:cupin domain-containing protein [Roseisolibacter sp. H3M3-2]MDF1502543.1 cupin domain-containing protein [Roseisolibacter sp. H3M3-2]